ncbi:hypothetical protein MPH_09230 [Macrophomina phaseolina MS6]|uniref:Uncharacterized protein n=1 Tax=Macrophomina phaseolina (strain MS6) TaxID=1126212 RepID=K2QVC7_MACPH|nr:hypothetical protein MPH_09230 [Macrophomina phaseolina MS6]
MECVQLWTANVLYRQRLNTEMAKLHAKYGSDPALARRMRLTILRARANRASRTERTLLHQPRGTRHNLQNPVHEVAGRTLLLQGRHAPRHLHHPHLQRPDHRHRQQSYFAQTTQEPHGAGLHAEGYNGAAANPRRAHGKDDVRPRRSREAKRAHQLDRPPVEYALESRQRPLVWRTAGGGKARNVSRLGENVHENVRRHRDRQPCISMARVASAAGFEVRA